MLYSTSVLSIVFFALSATGSPVPLKESSSQSVDTVLPFNVNLNISGMTLPKLDRLRAASLVQHAHDMRNKKNSTSVVKRATSFNVANSGVSYSAQVGFGSPPAGYTVLLDTGSSNTWIGAGKKYTPTNSSKNTGNAVHLSYGSGTMSGQEYIDTVTLSSGLVINNQSIGVANYAEGFSGVDGILGLGPVDLTQGTVANTYQVPTVSDNLLSQKKISTEVLGVSFNPISSSQSGELTFGDVDSSKYTGSIAYTPITTTFPSSYYWGVNEAIAYGSNNAPILSTTAGIVDTGTTLVMIATDAFSRYKTLTGAVEDPTTGLLMITNDQYAKLQSLFFTVGGNKLELTANGQTWPRSLNTAIGGRSNSVYLVVSDLGTSSGSGMDFIIGYTFLERFYSVYDTSSKRVGLAATSFTKAMSN